MTYQLPNRAFNRCGIRDYKAMNESDDDALATAFAAAGESMRTPSLVT